MGDWEDQLNRILNDPEQMAQLSQMARSLMGGGEAAEPSEARPAGPAGAFGDLADLGLDAGMLGRAVSLLRREEPGEEKKRALLRALEPWLSEPRREKLERAMKLARLSRLARLALREGQGDV